jgi:hypothetical protein
VKSRYENRIVVPSVPSAAVPSDVWELITTALKEIGINVRDRYTHLKYIDEEEGDGES